MRKAVFLDRDGTLVEDRGYLASPEEVVFYPETFAALAHLQQHFLLFIVTNQSGIARGEITRAQVEEVNEFIVSTLLKHHVHIQDVYVCPHARTDGCGCIKPNPYFLHIARDRYGIDLEHSYTIGDHPHDIELADRVGAKGIYVLSGHGQKHRAELSMGTVVVANIAAAAEHILREIV